MRKKTFLLLLLAGFFIFPVSILFGQENTQQTKDDDCQTREECEELLKKYEAEIAQYEKAASESKQKKKTLSSKIWTLERKIKRLELEIRQSKASIKEIEFEIADTQKSIEKTSKEIENSKKNLLVILRQIYKEDQRSYIEILFTEKKLSNFFTYINNLENLNKKNQEILADIKSFNELLKKEKMSLAEDKEDLEKAIKIQLLQKKESEDSKEEYSFLKKKTEAEYRQYLAKKKELEKKASKIMSRIAQLSLAGMKTPKTPEELYKLASWAGKLTGVRPALILGIIEGESALGANVGQCNCASQPYCKHPEISYKQVMSRKQWPAFLKITKELGLDPNTVPVSCVVNKRGIVQSGGAMGPAQFMPSTWLNYGYKKKVEELTGIKPANPWRPADAFLAAGLYLARFGAASQNRKAEEGAVTAYLCGTTNVNARNCRRAGGRWYTYSYIMPKVDFWQRQIDQGALK